MNCEKDNNVTVKITTALLMAAGMGTRIRPLSENTSKPLIPVNGVPIIETNIRALIKAGIENIYITVGYKKEKYYYLKEKYGIIEFIENKEYESKNTISSFYAAMDYLSGKNCYISESDLYIANPEIIKGEVDKSRYYLRFVPDQDYEWGFELEDDRVKKVVRPIKGIYLNHHMYGMAYWLKDDLDLLIESVKQLYKNPGHEGMAYDEAANYIFDKINMGIIAVDDGQVYEIDSIDDLVKIDSSYMEYTVNKK